jgi:hypothetical protein
MASITQPVVLLSRRGIFLAQDSRAMRRFGLLCDNGLASRILQFIRDEVQLNTGPHTPPVWFTSGR